jgi:CheY-like chemotaxis protein
LAKFGRPGDAARAEEWGFAAYLIRPVSDEQLADACTAVLGAPVVARDAAAEAGTATGRIVTRHTLAEQKKSRVRVLVVEDNPIDQLVVQSALRRMGYEPQVVTNGQEALTAHEAEPFDVILMDLQMPELDGLATTRVIRAAEPTGRRVPILALTASSSDEDRARCEEAGMDEFLSKPLDLELLAGRVEEWIRRTQDAQAIAAAETEPATEAVAPEAEPAPIETPVAIEEPVAIEAPVATEEAVAIEEPAAIEAPAAVEEPAAVETPTFVEADASVALVATAVAAKPAAIETPTAAAQPAPEPASPAPAPEPELDFEPTGVVLDPERLEASSMGSPEIRRMLVQAFFNHLEKPLGALRLALQAGDSSAVEFQAHSMKGMCASVGAVRCAELFDAVETRSAAGQSTALWPIVHRATFELARVEAILREDSNEEERQAA